MPRPPKNIGTGAAEQMVVTSIGEDGGLSILEIMRWVFGKHRTEAGMRNPKKDPEFVAFALFIDSRVNRAWKERGIDRRQGPYVNTS
jgi:hypothetical protein